MVRKTNIVVEINVVFIIFTSLQSAFDFVNASFLHFVLDLSRLKISYVFYFVHINFFDTCLYCFSTCPFQMRFQKFQVEDSFPTPHDFFWLNCPQPHHIRFSHPYTLLGEEAYNFWTVSTAPSKRNPSQSAFLVKKRFFAYISLSSPQR